MEELIEILEKIKPGIDYSTETGLFEKGLLDSMSIIRIVSEISDNFDVELEVTDLVPENFNSASAMMKLIELRIED